MMDELLHQFLIEGRDLVAQATADLGTLARDAADEHATDSAFRAIHTLKGSVAIFGLDPAERLLHAAEDLLERAKKGGQALDPHRIAALTGCMDQIDRWIDDMEHRGALPADADAAAGTFIARLAADASAAGWEPEQPAFEGANGAANADAWVSRLHGNVAAAVADTTVPLIAFRYTPDADCFFRGEDPLAVVEAVPGLLCLTISPADGAWPGPDLEPFSCFSIIEGVSEATEDEVRAAFRLQPGQLNFARIEPRSRDQVRREGQSDTSLLRVDVARVNSMADSLGDLVVAINGLSGIADELAVVDERLTQRMRAAQASIERAAAKVHRDLSAVRMVPLEPTLRRLPRLAREIADSLGKTVTLSITGGTTEADKQVADGLYEPLLHLLRNAIDHGIEPADIRRAAGKPAAGAVHLAFQRHGDSIVATLRDDGAGIDPARIRDIACSRGLLTREAAQTLSDAAALRLIFLPGFSTAENVTEISGRGVGMDAVQSAVEKMRGTIEIESDPGRGTLFRISLPGNALTTPLLVVEAGGERYGIALEQVTETARVHRAALKPIGQGLACVLRNRTIPVLDLGSLLGAQGCEDEIARLVVTRCGGEAVALQVDAFAERIETVVRQPAGILSSLRGVAGSALLGDGGVLLVLDLPELVG